MLKNFYYKKNKKEIEPEEILLDEKMAMKLEIPIKNSGFFIVFAAVIIILTSFLARSFWLQIKNGDYYAARSGKNNIRFYLSQPPRGAIYDSEGKTLASNLPDVNLLIIPAALPKNKDELNDWSNRLAEVLKESDSGIKAFIGNLNKNSTEPVLLISNINHDAWVRLSMETPKLPGVFINEEARRDYINGDYFSHLIGYTGKVSANDLKQDSYYSVSDFIGKTGLESRYEKELRGDHGKIAIAVDSENNVLKTLTAKEPLSGNNLILSVNAELQKVLTDALRLKLEETNSGGAAAVVLNVNSGEILAMTSLPSFDNNVLANNLNDKNYRDIVKSKSWSEFNRVISGAYSSGSTIKPFIAAAALAENIINPEAKIDDTLGYIEVPNQYDKNIVYTYRDWKAHGFVDMRRAIAVSADVYFYEIGGGYKNIKGLGINRIKNYLNIFGFGSDTGIDLPGEAAGLIPDPVWKKSVKNEGWFTGDTYNVSIGQGDVLVTPLQMASAIAAIANGGALIKPKIVSKITDSGGRTIKEFRPEIIRKNFIGQDDLKIVREGMRRAVTEGSAWGLKSLTMPVAGKTGTAQVTNTFKKTNAWFTGFAPYENPEVALAIVIEGAGEGSAAAVPVAKQVFEWYYNKIKNEKLKINE